MFGSKKQSAPVKAPAKTATAKKAPVKLEAKEAASRATNADKVVPTGTAAKAKKPDLRTEYPNEYDAGKRAARSGIPKDQAPVFYGKDAEKAWLEGYNG